MQNYRITHARGSFLVNVGYDKAAIYRAISAFIAFGAGPPVTITLASNSRLLLVFSGTEGDVNTILETQRP